MERVKSEYDTAAKNDGIQSMMEESTFQYMVPQLAPKIQHRKFLLVFCISRSKKFSVFFLSEGSTYQRNDVEQKSAFRIYFIIYFYKFPC